VSALPDGEMRKIENTDVFGVTASASVFAYIWLVFILSLSSPDVVDPWESLVTFSFFPLLVMVAFCADKGYIARLCGGSGDKQKKMKEQLTKKYGKELPPQ